MADNRQDQQHLVKVWHPLRHFRAQLPVDMRTDADSASEFIFGKLADCLGLAYLAGLDVFRVGASIELHRREDQVGQLQVRLPHLQKALTLFVFKLGHIKQVFGVVAPFLTRLLVFFVKGLAI